MRQSISAIGGAARAGDTISDEEIDHKRSGSDRKISHGQTSAQPPRMGTRLRIETPTIGGQPGWHLPSLRTTRIVTI